MPWTAADIILEARDHHPAFDERQTPDPVARRTVDRYAAELYDLLLEREADEIISTEEISFPLTDFDAGYDLPDFVFHHNGEVFYNGTAFQDPLNIVPFQSRHTPGVPNAAYIRENTIHFVGNEADWTVVEKVEFYYSPPRTPLADLTTDSELPDVLKPAAVKRLALFMAQRGPEGRGTEPVPISLTAEDWKESEQRGLRAVGRKRSSDVGHIREVW